MNIRPLMCLGGSRVSDDEVSDDDSEVSVKHPRW